MPQFALYRNPTPLRATYPYLVDLQNDLVSYLQTRLVAPLARASVLKMPMDEVTPIVKYKGVQYVVVVPMMAAIRRRELTTPIGSLEKDRDELVRAIDRLVTGL